MDRTRLTEHESGRSRFVVPSDCHSERIDRVLAAFLEATSRAEIQRWIANGRVLLNGRVCAAKAKVRAGDVIDYEPAPLPVTRAEPDASVVVEVVFEDEDLVVINKPAGMVVHPARGHFSGTLVNGLLARGGFARPPSDPLDPHGHFRPGVVHRLDKDTSGLIVVAKNERTREGLKAQFSARRVERSYIALTTGCCRSGSIRTGYGRHPTQRMKFTSRTDGGKHAITHVELVEEYEHLAAMVRCRLETGRTHQIRVHLAEQCATPLLADQVYGHIPRDPRLREIAQELGRQALHAGLLGFIHPVTLRPLKFEVPLPEDMQRAVQRLQQLRTVALP